MGQLADDVADEFRRVDYRRRSSDHQQDIVDRIDALEARVTELEASLATRHRSRVRAFGVIRDQFEQMCALLDEAGCKTDRTPEAIIAALTRLVAAERKAEQAWAAVTLMAARDEACIGVHQGAPSTMEYVDNNGNPYRSALLNYVPVHCVTAVFAVNAPANPDLLERASVELAEAYQRAKAEEQRQAEEKAVAT